MKARRPLKLDQVKYQCDGPVVTIAAKRFRVPELDPVMPVMFSWEPSQPTIFICFAPGHLVEEFIWEKWPQVGVPAVPVGLFNLASLIGSKLVNFIFRANLFL